jgi:hypothetical protein
MILGGQVFLQYPGEQFEGITTQRDDAVNFILPVKFLCPFDCSLCHDPPGFLTSSLLTSALVFVPWTGIEKITTINTKDRFHIRHHDGFNQIEPVLVKENGSLFPIDILFSSIEPAIQTVMESAAGESSGRS